MVEGVLQADQSRSRRVLEVSDLARSSASGRSAELPTAVGASWSQLMGNGRKS